ncbi:MAG: stress response translation initiation inhibitor YciH [Desulfuromonas sp.]|nr:MAG: stress response translation initiation inhibitor YciH [Desulfuromonas sp.]
MREKHRPVYSSDKGRLCPTCTQPVASCRCNKKKAVPPPKGDGVVRIGRESKGRKGKGVTLITGMTLNPDELKALAADLKKLCGCGGTVKDGVIEIQGEQRQTLFDALQKRGFKVKLSGG